MHKAVQLTAFLFPFTEFMTNYNDSRVCGSTHNQVWKTC